jgi:hypothetical protein
MATTTLDRIKQFAPDSTFQPGKHFCWSPESTTITYSPKELKSEQGVWSLLHEVGHSLLAHNAYATDFELVGLEVAAWEKAKELGRQIDIVINEDHIQDCLDTYRDWLHRRSTCPTCGSTSLQDSPKSYYCHNCHAIWHVTAARFCRPYRKLKH